MPSPFESLKEDLLKLAGLSETETKIFEYQSLLESLPANIKEMEQKLIASNESLNLKKQNLEELERKYRQLEAELNDSREKAKAKEAKLYELKTTKEFQASTKEVSTTKKLNLEQETQLIQLLDQIEKLKNELPALEEETGSLQQNIENEKNQIQEELDKIQNQLAEQLKNKEALCSSIHQGLISRYERILVRRQPAIAPVRSGTCQECNMNVPPQLYIEIQKCLQVISCPSCNRILYIPVF